VIPTLEKICGPGVRVIDPAPAVARQVGRVLQPLPAREGRAEAESVYYTSGPAADFERALVKLKIESAGVRGVRWDGNSSVS
jgi:glutamate racemase